jgi:hypothetical protein
MVLDVTGSSTRVLILPPAGPWLVQVALIEGGFSTGRGGRDVLIRMGEVGGITGAIVGVFCTDLVAVSVTDVLVGLAVEATASQAIDKTINKGRMI